MARGSNLQVKWNNAISAAQGKDENRDLNQHQDSNHPKIKFKSIQIQTKSNSNSS